MLSRMNGNIVTVGDFDIDWLNTTGSERRQFCNILKLLDLFKIYALNPTESIIYLTILSLERIVTLYQTLLFGLHHFGSYGC